ncbi:MAG: thioredoxin domain-containing protein [Candidatus Pacebacteria bacterium]|nr:thioredoxin domain-containing protein [Candidatus Paceibacterota bacterium]
MSENNKEQNNIYIIASSVIVAGLLIAGAVVYDSGPSIKNGEQANVEESLGAKIEISVSPVSDSDHVLGNRNAPVKIFEYSDLECPYCGRFQETMLNDIKADYIDSGKVAWVYRHLPLNNHVGAKKKAEASECVAELGGNEAFWKFADELFKNEQLEVSKLSELAKSIGVDEKSFSSCLESGKYIPLIDAEAAEAGKNGAEGTPFSLVFNEKGYVDTIPGAYPADFIKSVLDKALEN